MSGVHSTLTVPTPQFGELMTQFAGLFAQVHILHKANLTWSLSKSTFPHAFVRVLIAEQLYRAHSILENHPYHRE